ncbi:uncharacterized protein LOC107489037 [Arachis duranensis]|uniref:Uncharacterized protein LOC107489037 n=1 Tax=Arachis duranensis TaxID=130453 RepID=A0A6P4DDN8_ARADU|nr:uncharacterized protein LOC107489037 [Arachis duranensis]
MKVRVVMVVIMLATTEVIEVVMEDMTEVTGGDGDGRDSVMSGGVGGRGRGGDGDGAFGGGGYDSYGGGALCNAGGGGDTGRGFGDYFIGCPSNDTAMHDSQTWMSPDEMLSNLLGSEGLDAKYGGSRFLEKISIIM